MSIKIKARERLIRFNSSDAGEYRYVMQPEIYTTVEQQTIMKQVAQRSGLPEYSISAVFNALSEVMTIWATNGHSVPIPGLGTMRFGLRAQSVADVKDVGTSLIRSRRIIFTPSGEIKQLFSQASVGITCYDRDGKIVKRIESKDDGTIEDPEAGDTNGDSDQQGGSGSTGGSGTDDSGGDIFVDGDDDTTV